MNDLSEIEKLFLEKLAAPAELRPERWNDIIVKTPHHALTKKDLFDYYSHQKIREAMLAQIKGKPSIIIQHFSPTEPVLKRMEKGAPIIISKDSGEVDDPSDYQYWIERRATEFHPTYGQRTKVVHVDIDPKIGYPWEHTKEITQKVKDLLGDHPNVNETSLRFSGGKGFYVLGELDKEVNTDDAREMVKDVLKPLTNDPKVTLGLAKPGQVRLDTSTLKNTGSIRGIYSLNKETGYVSVPLEEENLPYFQPEHATIFAVIGRKPQSAVPIRK